MHVDFAEAHTEEGKTHFFVAIDRTSKLAFAELQPQATKMLAADFLRRVLAAIPYKVHKILTDNGTRFGNMPHQVYAWRQIFDRVCDEHGIEHRFTKPAHPWTNGQVERFNRTLKEATVRQYQGSHESRTQINNAGLFAPPPANVRTNVRNLKPDSPQRAVGYFAGYTVRADSLVTK